jgi:hypothetical protein
MYSTGALRANGAGHTVVKDVNVDREKNQTNAYDQKKCAGGGASWLRKRILFSLFDPNLWLAH